MTQGFGGFGNPQGGNPQGGQGGFGQPRPQGNHGGFGQAGQHGGFGQPHQQGRFGGFDQPSQSGSQSGFGQPGQGPSRADMDYRFADSASSISPQKPMPSFAQRMRTRVSYRAPWTLLLAGLAQLGTVGWVIYKLQTMDRPDNYTEIVVGWTIVLIVLVALAALVIKGDPIARIALTVMCVFGVLLLALGGFAPVGLLSLITIVLIWLPVNREWFTHNY